MSVCIIYMISDMKSGEQSSKVKKRGAKSADKAATNGESGEKAATQGAGRAKRGGPLQEKERGFFLQESTSYKHFRAPWTN